MTTGQAFSHHPGKFDKELECPLALDIGQGMRPRDGLAQRSLIDAPATWKILVNSRKGDESQRVIRFWISRLEVLRIRLFAIK